MAMQRLMVAITWHDDDHNDMAIIKCPTMMCTMMLATVTLVMVLIDYDVVVRVMTSISIMLTAMVMMTMMEGRCRVMDTGVVK
jgi:hypothetical protein